MRLLGLFDLLHNRGTVMPKRTDAIDHDLGLLDGIFDGQRVEDIELEYLDGIVDGQADGEKLGAGPRGQPDGEF